MTPEELVAIRARVDAATGGPWWQSGPPWFDVGTYVLAFAADPHVGDVVGDCGPDLADVREEQAPDGERDANTEFVAHARVDVPRLLDEVERSRADAARAHERAERAEASNVDLHARIERLGDRYVDLDQAARAFLDAHGTRAYSWVLPGAAERALRAVLDRPEGGAP